MGHCSGLARLELWQNFLADFFEVLGGVALAILEVEDNVVLTGRAQAREETTYDVSASAETEVDGLWWGVRVIAPHTPTQCRLPGVVGSPYSVRARPSCTVKLHALDNGVHEDRHHDQETRQVEEGCSVVTGGDLPRGTSDAVSA
jgi:hypothetical protein